MPQKKIKNWEEYEQTEQKKSCWSMVFPSIFTIIFMAMAMFQIWNNDNTTDIPLALSYFSIALGFLSLTISLGRTESLKIEKIETMLENIQSKLKSIEVKK